MNFFFKNGHGLFSFLINGNPLYLTDDVATLTPILTHIYEGSLKNVI